MAHLRGSAASEPSNTDFECTVWVTNRGPNASTYGLILDEDGIDDGPNCSLPVDRQLRARVDYPELRRSKTRKEQFLLDCKGGSGDQLFSAQVIADARDPQRGNNKRQTIIDIG